jgi:flagellar hook protein FlgE
MRIESALYASKQGIDAHGKAISVIGDNISNANTVGYKGSRIEFSDLLSTGEEGTEPSTIPQTGSGVQVQKVRQLHETGAIEFSGRALDVAIGGQGFFMVGETSAPTFTRAGNFEISPDGILVNADGAQVLGYSGNTGTTLGALDMINIDLTGEATTTGSVVGNISSTSSVSTPPVNPERFTELGTNASFATNITTYDSLGAERGVALYYFKTGSNSWTVDAYAAGADVGNVDETPVKLGSVDLTFDENGSVSGGSGTTTPSTLDVTANWLDAAPANVSIDLSGMTQFATGSQISNITRNGQSAGAIKEYFLEADGGVFARLSSGSQVQIGTLQLANVRNVDGLDRIGNAAYKETDRSGERLTGSPGTLGLGGIDVASLERSTVDISKEFVDLVLYQRGYQANSQIMNAANDIIRDTISLVR